MSIKLKTRTSIKKNLMKNAMWFVVPEVLAISPIRKKKAQNVKRNIALKGSEKMCSKAIFKLLRV